MAGFPSLAAWLVPNDGVLLVSVLVPFLLL